MNRRSILEAVAAGRLTPDDADRLLTIADRGLTVTPSPLLDHQWGRRYDGVYRDLWGREVPQW